MNNDYEVIDHDDQYMNDNDMIDISKSEYHKIINNLIAKNKNLETKCENYYNENKLLYKKTNLLLCDLDNLTHNFEQLEKDLYDMECVNLELLKIIKS